MTTTNNIINLTLDFSPIRTLEKNGCAPVKERIIKKNKRKAREDVISILSEDCKAFGSLRANPFSAQDRYIGVELSFAFGATQEYKLHTAERFIQRADELITMDPEERSNLAKATPVYA